MDVKTTTFNFERIRDTVLHHYAIRLQEYGYLPRSLRTANYKDDRGHTRSLHLFEFAAGNSLRVVFLVSRGWYRLKIQDGDQIIFRSPNYVCSTRWERPFLYHFNDDDRPIYPRRETMAERRAAQKEKDKQNE